MYVGTHVSWCACEGQRTILTFHHVGLRDLTQVIWLGPKYIYPLNHLARLLSPFLWGENLGSQAGWASVLLLSYAFILLIVRQGLTELPGMALNLLCSPGRLGLHQPPVSASRLPQMMTGVCH